MQPSVKTPEDVKCHIKAPATEDSTFLLLRTLGGSDNGSRTGAPAIHT